MIDARFGHVNLVARDWRPLATFYERVFGCVPVPPERDYSGRDLEAATGIPGVRLRGVHLRLPGGGPGGPTLEIYEYEPALPAHPPAANRPGFGHIAFAVPDVHAAREAVLAEGGGAVGEVVTLYLDTCGKNCNGSSGNHNGGTYTVSYSTMYQLILDQGYGYIW
jgi:catechol 2,3-dioxygenase-like lactoylglutathione lyase family enzyme